MNKEAKQTRMTYISALRALAMVMVLTPHILAYRIDTMAFRYLAHYMLNPLHIIQFSGAIGVSIFFITSGYLMLNQIGGGRFFQRFLKSVVVMIVQVFIAIIFVGLIVFLFEFLFDKFGYTSTYITYSFRDWIESALLYRNIFYMESCEAALWFLVPFLFFKILLLVFDYFTDGNKLKVLYSFWGSFILGYMVLKLTPSYSLQISLITDRFFYIGIILIGYIFALLHSNNISITTFIIYVAINGSLMLIGTHMTVHGVDNGYIVQAIYATMIFIIFYKMKNYIKQNKFISFTDNIGLSFFLLHNGIGWTLLQLFYYCIFPNHAYISMFITVCLDILIIALYYYIIQRNVDSLMKRILNAISLKIYTEK